jgi:hypothetical protein
MRDDGGHHGGGSDHATGGTPHNIFLWSMNVLLKVDARLLVLCISLLFRITTLSHIPYIRVQVPAE